ncbi:hypothetical protein D3C81_1633550 [compost metagenome]
MREVKRLCHGAVIGAVNHHDLIAYRLIDHGIGTAGADIAGADDRHFSRFCFQLPCPHSLKVIPSPLLPKMAPFRQRLK